MRDMRLSYFTRDESFPFFIQYGEHRSNMHMHRHEDFSELVIVLGGSAEHIVGQERFSVRKGDVFLIGQETFHGYENPRDFRICNIMFRPETLLAADYDVKKLPGFHALFLLNPHFGDPQGFKSRLRLSPDAFGRIETLIMTAVEEYGSDTPGKKTMLTALFLELAVMLSRACGSPEKHREIAGIAEAAAYMEQHYTEDLSIKDIFRVSHYSQRHFVRLFTQAYRTTPQQYLLNIRMRHACTLLRESGLNVTEIALSCGYKDSNYFSRSFKKYTGTTPSGYRKG